MTTVTNGVNVQALLDAREVLKGARVSRRFQYRAVENIDARRACPFLRHAPLEIPLRLTAFLA